MCRPAYIVRLEQKHMTTEWKCHSYTDAERKAVEVSIEQGVKPVLERRNGTDRGRTWVIDTTI